MSYYRYPGVNPFTTEEASIFFGRETDTAHLLQLVRFEQVVVLYGKSGLGKSSLLNAGLLPAIRTEGKFKPIVIRFGAWTQDKIDTPATIVKQSLIRDGYTQETILDRLLSFDNSLWYFAKTRQLNGGGDALLLVFDQFEELFTCPESAITEFKIDLSELLLTGIPQRFRRALEDSATPTANMLSLLHKPLEVKIVLAIRADRMHLLDHLSSHLPNILRHCYRLEALRRADAENAIVQPAIATEGEFATSTFTYTPAALTTLLDYLEDPIDHRVEGILLQMLCENFEKDKVKKQGIQQIDTTNIGNLEKLVENYYHDKINALGPIGRRAIRRLIEEGLVVEGDNTRLNLHEEQIIAQFGVTKEMLEKLVDCRLLRAEPYMRGGYSYELSHDRLVPPVLKAKVERLLAEEIRMRKNILEESRLKQVRSRRTTTLLTFTALTFLITAMIAYWQTTDIVFAKKLIQREQSYLNLSSLDIEYLPFEFWQSVPVFNSLSTLDISYTKISILPAEIEVYKVLKELYLAGTTISQLPSEIGNLPDLQILDLSRTQLTQLPSSIGKLTKLRDLNLSHTPLVQLLPEIGNLPDLQILDLSRTQLTQLPSEIGNLTNLQTLDLSRTELTQLPPEIGRLTNLQMLDLSRTELTQLPPEIGNLTSLQVLNLSNTKITSLPIEIFKLRSLTILVVEETSISIDFATLFEEIPQCRVEW